METIKGQIERLTFVNEENGFTVAQILIEGQKSLVTAVGIMNQPLSGELVEIYGQWEKDLKYGLRFKIDSYKTKAPASTIGLKKYLSSGLIKGIGPVLAERIVSRFGLKTLEILENNPHRLTEIEGLGLKKREQVIKDWQKATENRKLMVFLAEFGLGPAIAAKIIKILGAEAENLIRKNPYRLSYEIEGIGFLTADKVANSLGISEQHPKRIEAGIIYALSQKSKRGHTFSPLSELIADSIKILEVEKENVILALGRLTFSRQIIMEKQNEPGDEHVFLENLFLTENKIAQNLKKLLKKEAQIKIPRADKALLWAEKELNLKLAEKQKEAILTALNEKILLITGGPGTGKTTITRAISKIYGAVQAKIALAAPTGRAAKKLSQATGLNAKTIHRLLEFSHHGGGFIRGPKNPLEADLILIDEASMLDIFLFNQLLDAVNPRAILILIGDRDQLPSVGPGNVLGDIIDCKQIKVIELKDIFRQSEQSQIIIAAHQINKGEIPHSSPTPDGDFYFLEENDPNEIINKIIYLVSERIPEKLNLNPINDLTVLTPMNRGLLGTDNLNQILSQHLNKNPDLGIKQAGRIFRTGDKVIQLKNNYDHDIFNGDLGRIRSIDKKNGELSVEFEDLTNLIHYQAKDLTELGLAYALTIHKSQGSEFPAIVIPISTLHYIMLRRNLLYTAVTRGKQFVVLIGSYKALQQTVKNDQETRRYTSLAQKIIKLN